VAKKTIANQPINDEDIQVHKSQPITNSFGVRGTKTNLTNQSQASPRFPALPFIKTKVQTQPNQQPTAVRRARTGVEYSKYLLVSAFSCQTPSCE
jgi:hypothetical protein